MLGAARGEPSWRVGASHGALWRVGAARYLRGAAGGGCTGGARPRGVEPRPGRESAAARRAPKRPGSEPQAAPAPAARGVPRRGGAAEPPLAPRERAGSGAAGRPGSARWGPRDQVVVGPLGSPRRGMAGGGGSAAARAGEVHEVLGLLLFKGCCCLLKHPASPVLGTAPGQALPEVQVASCMAGSG